jgi:phage minor structural protein
MIQVYADGALVYDSRLEEYDLVGLKVTTGLNVGGTAEIVMPVGHPAYSTFVSHKTIVTVYRDGVLRFRGRALYPADNFLGQRTITCEGELCLLRDSINRPYKYQASPRSIFVTLINAHNGQTDAVKKFTVGEVTVVDSNDYVLLESESAETILDTLNKAVERVGGYITFTDAEDGSRVINWLEELDRENKQVIEFGENLLDFSSTGANTTALVTGLVPYGKKDENTKKRLTIASVNGGKDYILAEDAVAVRGTIMGTAVWDDVEVASNLLKKAQAYLAQSKMFITSLTLTALDLSYMDKKIDSFSVGDVIRVRSAPHDVDEDFQLTTLTEDLLNPAQSRITLGKDVQTLTGADVESDKKGQSALTSVRVQLDNGQDLTGFVTQDDLSGYATQDDLVVYVKQGELSGYASNEALELVDDKVDNEVNARAGIINKVDGTVHISGGAPVKILGGKVEVLGDEVHIGDADHVTHLYGGDRIKVHGRMHMMDGTLDFSNNQGVRCYNNDGTVVYILRIDPNNNTIVGTAGNNLYLRGPAVYLGGSNEVVTSDRRNKHSIEELPDAYVEALDKMTPVRFKYNEGTSDRYHVGFIAQDVEAALTEAGLCGKDFGGFVDLNGDGETLGLAYDEFIGLLFQKIRKLEKKIKAIEEANQ